jgi:N-acetylmuramoyl-L-alanine amidase
MSPENKVIAILGRRGRSTGTGMPVDMWLALLGAAVVVAALAGCGAQAHPVASTALGSATAPVAPASRTATPALTAASGTGARALAASARAPSVVPRPVIHQWPIPFGAARKRQMAAYSLRHYGEETYRLTNPKVIVEHYTETATAGEAYNTFAPDVPDSEFHELPNTCAQFLVEPTGRIDQLVSLSLRCRHTVGLNWTAIGIENIGLSDREILDRPAQMTASLALTRWLRCRYAIPLKDVIGHNESLSSPYHRERVPAFAHQTHSDWNRADMQRYRGRLASHGCS